MYIEVGQHRFANKDTYVEFVKLLLSPTYYLKTELNVVFLTRLSMARQWKEFSLILLNWRRPLEPHLYLLGWKEEKI